MKYLGKFATREQLEDLKGLQGAPCLVFGGQPPRDPLKTAHRYALEQGLPEIEGYYGCDLGSGEFIST